jgi:hypothetical protein
MYYDKGYSDATTDTKRDSRIPKVLGAVCLTALAWFNVGVVWAFLSMWATFEIVEWWDESKYHDSDPPPMWEDQ